MRRVVDRVISGSNDRHLPLMKRNLLFYFIIINIFLRWFSCFLFLFFMWCFNLNILNDLVRFFEFFFNVLYLMYDHEVMINMVPFTLQCEDFMTLLPYVKIHFHFCFHFIFQFPILYFIFFFLFYYFLFPVSFFGLLSFCYSFCSL